MVMRLEPLLPFNKFNPLKRYFFVVIIFLKGVNCNCCDEMHFYFTYDLNPTIFQSCYLGDGNFFQRTYQKITRPLKLGKFVNYLFILYCLYSLHFVQLGKCTRQIHFIFTFSQFHFLLHEQVFISQRSKIISFPLNHHYSSSSFPLSLFNQTLSPKRSCSN